MALLVVGLLLFLGTHSVRIFADDWRSSQRNRFGEMRWKAVYSLISILGFILIVWGFGRARYEPTFLWMPPAGMLHLTSLLTLIAFVLIAAAYIPRNHIKSTVHHPMALGILLWATGHLLANGTLADVILFGSFLIWSVLSFKAARRRDALKPTPYPVGTISGTALCIIAGMAIWVAFAFRLHTILIGVPLF